MFFVDWDDEAKYLMKRSGCTEEQAFAFLETEDAFYDSKGLCVYEPEEVKEEFRNAIFPQEPDENASVIDNDEMVEYISEKTGMDFDFVEQLSFYAFDYTNGEGASADFIPYRERRDIKQTLI